MGPGANAGIVNDVFAAIEGGHDVEVAGLVVVVVVEVRGRRGGTVDRVVRQRHG